MVSHLFGSLNQCRIALAMCALGGVVFADAQDQGYIVHKVMDTQGTGGVAITYQMPKSWTGHDSVYWNLNVRMNPMSYSLMAGSPDSFTWFSYLSALSFDFASSGFGGMAGKPPPQRPSDFLMQDFQAIHPNTPYEVVDRQDNPIPFPYKPTVPGITTSAYHSVLRARFTRDGTQLMQEFSLDFYGYTQPTGPSSYVGNWIVDGVTVVTGPEAQFSEAQQTCRKILLSAKMDPGFFSRYQQVTAMLLQKTKAETQAELYRRAHQVVVTGGGGGGGSSRVMDKDTFLLHEEIKGLRSKIFSWSIGN